MSLLPAAVLFLVSLVLLRGVNNLFRGGTSRKLKAGYWASMEDLTGTYLENVRGLSTFKLFGRDGDRQRLLEEKSQDFNRKVMGCDEGELLLLPPDGWAHLRFGGGWRRCWPPDSCSQGSCPFPAR